MRLDSRRVRAEKRKKEQENLELDLRQKTSRVNMLEDMEKNMEAVSYTHLQTARRPDRLPK